MKNIIQIFVLSLIIMSCSSSDDSNSNDNGNEQEEILLLIKNISKNGILITSFDYYDNDKLKTKFSYSGINPITSQYTYTNTNTILQIYNESGELFSSQELYSINDESSRIDHYNSNIDLTSYRIYTFSNNSCGFDSIDLFDQSNNLVTEHMYTYFDDNCSADVIINNVNTGKFRIEYTMDNKQYAEVSSRLPFFKRDINHNTKSLRFWFSNDQLNNDASYDSDFEYNNDNYPITETRTYLSGLIEEYTYEYY